MDKADIPDKRLSAIWGVYFHISTREKIQLKPTDKFAEFYELIYDDLWFYCLRRTASAADAEDILGDTFVIAWQKFDKPPTLRDARPWLFTIAANVLRNHNRKQTRRQRIHLRLVDDAENAHPTSQHSPETLALGSLGDIELAFRGLRVADQEILALAAWEELSNREIGVLLNCSELAVRSRLYRARKRFDHLLKDARRHRPTQHVAVEEVTNYGKRNVNE